MAPKSNVDTYLTEDRINELKEHFENIGIEMKGVRVADLEFLDRALQSGWKAPKKAALEHEDAEATGHKKHTRLVTYLVHNARNFLNEPVGQKNA